MVTLFELKEGDILAFSALFNDYDPAERLFLLMFWL